MRGNSLESSSAADLGGLYLPGVYLRIAQAFVTQGKKKVENFLQEHKGIFLQIILGSTTKPKEFRGYLEE